METRMPIRAAPFAHQREAFEFAMSLFVVGVDDVKNEHDLCKVWKTNLSQTEHPQETPDRLENLRIMAKSEHHKLHMSIAAERFKTKESDQKCQKRKLNPVASLS